MRHRTSTDSPSLRPTRFRLATCLAIVLVALAACPTTAAVHDADTLRSGYGKLLELREELMDELEDRQKQQSRPVAQYALRLYEAADGDDCELVLRRTGDVWRDTFAFVPAWAQSTMQEWRGYHLGNGVACDWRPRMRFKAGPVAMALRDHALTGSASITFLYDRTLDDRLPPGKLHGWWDRFIPSGQQTPRTQNVKIDARVRDDKYLFEFVLSNGVRWEGVDKKTGKTVVTRRPIVVRLAAPGHRFDVLDVQTPTWNGGAHEADATGLKFADGKLAGRLVVYLHQDGWVPYRGGKVAMVPPVTVNFDIDARLKHNRLTGTFKATGTKETLEVKRIVKGDTGLSRFTHDMGEYDGGLLGRGGPMIEGWYEADGGLGRRAGRVTGMALADPPALKEALADDVSPLPAGDREAATQATRSINSLLHDIRALDLALKHDGLPLAEALSQMDVTAPRWAGEDLSPEAITAYVQKAARLYANMGEPPTPLVGKRFVGPSAGAVALEADGEGVNALPTKGEDGWRFVSQWRLLGPFEQRPGLAHDAARAVEIVPDFDLPYMQTTDRFDLPHYDGARVTWQKVETSSPRIQPPWDKAGFYTRFKGEVWYGAATVSSEQARTVWLSLEAGDHAKLWVNGRLVWTDHNKPWRYHARGRTIVPVDLVTGANELLLRVHRDRRPSWVELAMTRSKPVTADRPAPTGADFAGPLVFPGATPPIAWDIKEGINVAWRNEKLGGRMRPVVVGAAVLVTSAPHTLICADLATGTERWRLDANILELVDAEAFAAWQKEADPEKRFALLKAKEKALGVRLRNLGELVPSEPVSNGKTVWWHARTGALAAADLATGKRLWIKHTRLAKTKLHLVGDALVVEGDAASTWPVPPAGQEEKAATGKRRGRQPVTGLLVLDAATGDQRAAWGLEGSFQDDFCLLLRLSDAAGKGRDFVMTSTGPVLDVANRRLLPGVDVEPPAGGRRFGGTAGYPAGTGYCLTANRDTLYMTSQDQNIAVRLWKTEEGALAWDRLWESGYEHAGWGVVGAPAAADTSLLFSWMPVLDRGPHCTSPRIELHVQDAATGRVLARIKPVLEDAVMHHIKPVIAGNYVFCGDSGGGTHGGRQDFGQMAVLTGDATAQLLCRNFIELGTRAAPVFAGERMLLRSGKSLLCVRVAEEAGRRYQHEKIAATLLDSLGPKPAPEQTVTVLSPIEPGTIKGAAPVAAFIDGRPGECWLGAGPLAPDAVKDDRTIGSLAPTGETVVPGTKVRFAPLSREFAYRDPPVYRRQHALQGTGDIVPFFSSWVDARAVASRDGAGLLYTVVSNSRGRYITPMEQPAGVTMWLAGRKVQEGEALKLPPGLYPLVVRIEPRFVTDRTKQTGGDADLRLAPAFRELANLSVRLSQWLKRIEANRARLEAIVKELPKTDHAKRAAALLHESGSAEARAQ